MAKIHIYMLSLIVWLLIFHFAGLIDGTGTSYVLNNLGVTNPENFGSTQFYAILVSLAVLSIAGVTIGLYFGKSSDIVLLASTIAFASIFTLMLWDFIALFRILITSNLHLAILIISPLMVVFGLTIYEWTRGMST